MWDESGTWAGMPERIEEYMYDGLSQEEKQTIASGTFNTTEGAIAFGMESGKYKDEQHAQNDYKKFKKELKVQYANENKTLTGKLFYEEWRIHVKNKPELD